MSEKTKEKSEEELVKEIEAEYVKLGLATNRANRERAEEAAKKLYQLNNFKEPQIHWVESPQEGLALEKELVGTNNSGSIFLPQDDLSWFAYYKLLERTGKFDNPDDPVHEHIPQFQTWIEEVGRAWTYEDFVIFSEKPTRISFDEDEQLHHDTEHAILYSDGSGKCIIHDVEVPDFVVLDPDSITIEHIRSEDNAEVKRIMRERYGEGRYLEDVGAEIVDVDVSACHEGQSSINRALMKDDEGNLWLVGSDGSTPRVYHMRVPNTVKTCAEAHEALSGFDESKMIEQA